MSIKTSFKLKYVIFSDDKNIGELAIDKAMPHRGRAAVPCVLIESSGVFQFCQCKA